MSNLKRGLLICCALVILLIIRSQQSLAAGCSVSTSSIVFGDYDPIRPYDLPTVGQITYACTGIHQAVSIGLTLGNRGNSREREMSFGRRRLRYNLYIDPAGTRVWGDGTQGTEEYRVPAPVDGKAISLMVYGRAASRQDVSSGNYHDDVQVFVRY
jgi:spore coat protein U-like protein